jgi:protein phosphatase PTC7
MSDFGLSAKDKGGKSAYLSNVSERVGLSSNTSMAEPPTYVKAHLALEQSPLYMNVGVAALPHPFKNSDGSLARNLRDRNFQDLSTDPTASEDSYFITTVTLPDPANTNGEHHHHNHHPTRKFTYFGVADGVGSWREYGVDPKAFSHRLMMECENCLLEASRNGSTEGRAYRSVISPAQVLAQAYERVRADNIIGSSTACVALFDSVRHQLHFSNLGDSGLIVLRHIDSNVAGSLKRERHIPRTERKSDLRLAFVSQQQLRSFNHPYQLGWTGDEATNEEAVSFKTAREACTSSVHLRRGDIIIMATDGLFDNVDVDDICEMALEWEQSNGFLRGGDIASRDRRWAMGNSLTVLSSEVIDDLAQRLAYKARENSLDNTKDSPFAILAKENDVMWSGGTYIIH